MFAENFSFDPSRSPSLLHHPDDAFSVRAASRSVSPCSSELDRFPPSSRCPINDLALQFAGQRIQRRAQICYDSCAAYANDDDDEADWAIPSLEADNDTCTSSSSSSSPSVSASCSPSPPPPSRSSRSPLLVRPHSPSRRAQRQLTTRLLCSTTHHRHIAALLEQMVDAKDQCALTTTTMKTRTSSTPSPPPDSTSPHRRATTTTALIIPDDEGYDTGSDSVMADLSPSDDPHHRRAPSSTPAPPTLPSRTDYRRSGDWKSLGAGAACVQKTIRFRKDGARRMRMMRNLERVAA